MELPPLRASVAVSHGGMFGLVGLLLAVFGGRASAQVVDEDAAQAVDEAHRSEEAPPPPTAVLPEDREPAPGPRPPPPIDLFPERILGGAATGCAVTG